VRSDLGFMYFAGYLLETTAMKWLLKLIGYIPIEDRKGISIDNSSCWKAQLVGDWVDAVDMGQEDKLWKVSYKFLREIV